MPIKACSPPTPPILSCNTTSLFGVKRGVSGRHDIPIMGIVVHCIGDDYTSYLNKACKSSPKMMPCGHASMHYVIDAVTGQVSCLVKDTDIAWAFQSYLSNFPMTNPLDAYPGWEELPDLFPTLSADFYTLNIGIAAPVRPEVEILDGGEFCCLGPYGMTEIAYANLVRLIAWLADRYSIPVDTEHIALHDEIVEVKTGCEECLCAENCLICDISSYCESCSNAGDPSFILHNCIEFVYGESADGCKVKVHISKFMEMI